MRSLPQLTILLIFTSLWLTVCGSIANLPTPTAATPGTPAISLSAPTVTPTPPIIETVTKLPTMIPTKTRTADTSQLEITASPAETVAPETAACTLFPVTGILVQNGSGYTILEPLTGDRCQVRPGGRMEAPRLAAGQLYYVRFDEGSNSRAVWQTSADGNSQKLAFTSHLASEAFMLDFLISEDGRQIAWTAVTGTVDAAGNQQLTSDLWTANVDGSAQVQLLDDYGFHDNRRVLPLRFSRDGSYLYFALQPTGLGGIWTSYTGRYDSIYELTLAGGEPARLFDCQKYALFLCLGDFRIEEQLLVYTDIRNEQINVITWQGAVVNSYTPTIESFFGFPTFGPDGVLLLYAAAVTDDDLVPHPGTLNLAVPDTSEVTMLLEQEGLMLPITWLDERHILVLHSGHRLGGMAVITTDGTSSPLTLEDGAYAQYLGQ